MIICDRGMILHRGRARRPGCKNLKWLKAGMLETQQTPCKRVKLSSMNCLVDHPGIWAFGVQATFREQNWGGGWSQDWADLSHATGLVLMEMCVGNILVMHLRRLCVERCIAVRLCSMQCSLKFYISVQICNFLQGIPWYFSNSFLPYFDSF